VSPLLVLPGELRNIIYGYIFDEDTYYFRKYTTSHTDRSTIIKKLNLSILGVCRQTYTEAALLPFSLNTFSFTSSKALDLAKKSHTRAQRCAIASIRIRLHLTFSMEPNVDLALIKSKGRKRRNRLHTLLPKLKCIRVDFMHFKRSVHPKHRQIARNRQSAIKTWVPIGGRDDLRVIYTNELV
jgi:hypothetical protein